MDLSVSGTYLASGQITFAGFVADIVVWDLNAFESLRRFKLHKTQVASVSFSCDERLLASAGGQDDNTIAIWGLQDGKALMSVSLGGEVVSRIRFYNKDPLRLVSAHVTG